MEGEGTFLIKSSVIYGSKDAGVTIVLTEDGSGSCGYVGSGPTAGLIVLMRRPGSSDWTASARLGGEPFADTATRTTVTLGTDGSAEFDVTSTRGHRVHGRANPEPCDKPGTFLME